MVASVVSCNAFIACHTAIGDTRYNAAVPTACAA